MVSWQFISVTVCPSFDIRVTVSKIKRRHTSPLCVVFYSARHHWMKQFVFWYYHCTWPSIILMYFLVIACLLWVAVNHLINTPWACIYFSRLLYSVHYIIFYYSLHLHCSFVDASSKPLSIFSCAYFAVLLLVKSVKRLLDHFFLFPLPPPILNKTPSSEAL